ncbi:hypothetical protein KEC54_19410 [Methylorubrum extorquens]|uniref:Uncharacterized protein n=1 Tax=Methylorubrum extorquens TaxID=408 RepID=A0AAX3WF31_METEX|nr:hypothetical protein KEC54_19410 [Methylorubrum extorquens]
MPRRPAVADADLCRHALTPTEEAHVFVRDAVRATRASWSTPASADQAMLTVSAILAVDALFPELLTEPSSGGGPRD